MTFSLQTKNGYYHAVYRTTDQNGRTVQKWVTTGIKAARGNKKEAMRVAEKIVSERKENEGATQNAEQTYNSGSGSRCGWIKKLLKSNRTPMKAIYVTSKIT